MSEQVAETPAAEQVALTAPEVPQSENGQQSEGDAPAENSTPVFDADKYGAMAPMAQTMFDGLRGFVEQYNRLATDYHAATGEDEGTLLADLRESSDIPEVRESMTQVERLLAKAEEIQSRVDDILRQEIARRREAKGLNPEEIKGNLDKVRESYRAALNFAKTLDPDFAQYIPALASVAGSRKSGGSGAGTGGRKPRVGRIRYRDVNSQDWQEATEEVENANGEKRIASTFTILARKLGGKATATDLQSAYFDAAKTKDMDNVPPSVEFAATGADGKNYVVQVNKRTDA